MIFRRLYGDVPESMGPAFEQYFRNATQLVMEDPASGSTILDIARVLAKHGDDMTLVRTGQTNLAVKGKRLGEKGLFATLYAGIRADMLDAPYMRDFLLTAKDTSFSTLDGVSAVR